MINLIHGRGRKLAAAAATATAVAGLAIAAPAASASPTYVTRWVTENTCAVPAAGHSSCFALKLKAVKVRADSAAARTAPAARPKLAHPGFSVGPAGGYSPATLAKAYGVTASAATTQTVAIVDAFYDPSVKADLNAFDAHYGLPAETSTSFKVIRQDGSAVTTTNHPNSDAGWSTEITLDVDAVRGLCQKCKILLVETDTNDNDNLGAGVNQAVAQGALIVSNSYGGPETDPENTPQVAADYKHSNVAILASTGDDGYYAWDNFNEGGSSDNVPSTPASYNTVIGVGGTTLNLNSDGTRASESVWNENGPSDIWGFNLGAALGASGSGCSTMFTPQAWQSHVSGYSTLGCGSSLRNGVDIAAIADPYTGYDTYETTLSWCPSGGTDGNGNDCPTEDPSWETFGGTSLASPVIGALWALAGGPGGVTYPALSLYGHFKSNYSSVYDVTVGGTGLCGYAQSPQSCFGADNPNVDLGSGLVDCAWGASGTAILSNRYQCYARPGYDGVSGVGTPKGTSVFKPLTPTAVITHSTTITHGHSATFSGSHSTDPFPGGTLTKFVWAWGDGTASVTTTSTSTHHTYAKKGTFTARMKVYDNYGRVSAVKTATITVK